MKGSQRSAESIDELFCALEKGMKDTTRRFYIAEIKITGIKEWYTVLDNRVYPRRFHTLGGARKAAKKDLGTVAGSTRVIEYHLKLHR